MLQLPLLGSFWIPDTDSYCSILFVTEIAPSGLVKNGAKVYLVSRKLSQCEASAAELNKAGTSIHPLELRV